MGKETGSGARLNPRRGVLTGALWLARLLLVGLLVGAGFAGYRAWQALSEFPGMLSLGGNQAQAENTAYRIGIIAGHQDSDSGAVCEDGLREVDINVDVATRVVDLLQRLGYSAEVLDEFSPSLTGYDADVLVSIHSDSCIKGYSGFKVARAAHSAIPEQEDRLVSLLREEYAKSTGLSWDEAHITTDMTGYHAFNEIAPATPAAIIEIGYMSGDRRLLTKSPGRVARGIAAAITAFLQPTGEDGWPTETQ